MDRWERAGRVAAYGAAAALTPYLLIKVSWVVGALLGLLPVADGFSTGEWVALNGATIVMAGGAITVALALARPWGMRIPARVMVACAWIGTGFLVPLLPYALLSSAIDGGRAEPPADGDGATMPGWEEALIQAGFVGMGLGLAVSLPAYLRQRWPAAFAERPGSTPGGSATGWPVHAGVLLGVVWLYWGAGGTVGLAHPDERDMHWRALSLVFGTWALAAAGGTWAIAGRRSPPLPPWVPMTLAWLGSGSLFAWSAWKLPLVGYVAATERLDAVPVEATVVVLPLHLLGAVTGLWMLRALTGRVAS
jgi:hypothetical protein